jgi:hypothetical protein
MFIVLDSNIWIAELGLNTNLGSATRFYIRQNNARLVLPEVVRLEVEHNFLDRLKDFTKKTSDNYRQLLMAFGTLKELVLPSDEEIQKKVQEVFTNVGVDLLAIPFSLESARSSFLKTIRKLPPSQYSQQFKDGVLWADCCRLLENDDVYLITSDQDFYEGKKYLKGLATNLFEEASAQAHSLRIFPSLSGLLNDLKTEVALDIDALVNTFIQQNKASVEGILERSGFQIYERVNVSRELYATERPNTLYLRFTAEFACEDLTGEDRTEGRLLLKGDGSYNTDDKSFSDLRNSGEKLSFRLKDGSEQVIHNYILHCEAFLGHRKIVHTVRYPLDKAMDTVDDNLESG